MKLFLCSGELPYTSVPFFLKQLGRNPKDTKAVLIPTAADPYDDKWFVYATRDALKKFGFTVKDVDLKDDKDKIKQDLTDSQVICVSGGNTFYLLHWLRQSGVDQYLKQLLEAGRIYIGSSAGSIVVGPDIKNSGWGPDGDTNDIGISDTKGLNIVPFSVAPHFTEEKRTVLENCLTDVGCEILPITDQQAIYWENGQRQLLGYGDLVTLNNK